MYILDRVIGGERVSNMISKDGQHYILEGMGRVRINNKQTNQARGTAVPVTEAEYRAHHWCLAHGVEVPDGYEVIKFCCDIPKGCYWVDIAGGVIGPVVSVGGGYTNGPILRKKACEHPLPSQSVVCDGIRGIKCHDCGMVRKLGDWE